MLYLSLDSTASVSSVALYRDGETVGEYTVNSGHTHSVTLLPMIDDLLKTCSMTADDVDAFVLSAGPGSFTGVRIGAATIKGLALKKKTPCIGVSTLEALAYNMRGFEGIVCPSMNARRERVYSALFRVSGEKVERLTEDKAVAVAELPEILDLYNLDLYNNERIYFPGDAYSMVKHLSVVETPERLRLPSAASAAALGEKIYCLSEDKSFPASNLLPVYLSKCQAEQEREARCGLK